MLGRQACYIVGMTNYRHNILVGLALTALVVAIALFFSFLGHRDNSHPALNGSTDGRYHTCGYVTADGVTDHLDVFRLRCGGSQ